MGFKSGLWLGHPRMSRALSRSLSRIVLAVCFWAFVVLKDEPLAKSEVVCTLEQLCTLILPAPCSTLGWYYPVVTPVTQECILSSHFKGKTWLIKYFWDCPYDNFSHLCRGLDRGLEALIERPLAIREARWPLGRLPDQGHCSPVTEFGWFQGTSSVPQWLCPLCSWEHSKF